MAATNGKVAQSSDSLVAAYNIITRVDAENSCPFTSASSYDFPA
jgi:hypothetical protein